MDDGKSGTAVDISRLILSGEMSAPYGRRTGDSIPVALGDLVFIGSSRMQFAAISRNESCGSAASLGL